MRDLTVEELADTLSPADQLRLLAYVSGRLVQEYQQPEKSGYRERMLAALDECDRIAEQIDGEFDSAADLDMIRNERASR